MDDANTITDRQSFADRHIVIRHDAIGSAIVSGDGNAVHIYHYHLSNQTQAAALLSRAEASIPISSNPYRGLAAFQVEDAEVYFGREVQVERLWNRLRELSEQAGQMNAPPRFLPILGPSGSGKSSLARAGLLPELARRPLPGYRQSRVVVMTPGSTPLESLAVVLARIATGDVSPVEKAAEFERVLRRANDEGKRDGLRRIANALPGIESSPLVVLIDQFEEVYSLCKSLEERAAFIDGLIEAATTAEGRVLVIVTLRSDFLGEVQRHPKLNKIVGSDQSVIVPAMDESELRRAIAEPAKQAGRPLDEAIVDLLIEQTEGREGALPLLQFALTQIWEGMGASKTPAETLRTIGGVGGALAGEAQRIYNSLTVKEQNFARRLFIGVVELGEGTKDTRRRTTVESLMSAQDDLALAQAVIGRFSAAGARLLTLSSAEGKEMVEVTHEALFEHWQQLKVWLDGQRDRIRQQRHINALAEEWSKQGKKRGYLLQGRQLDDARDFHKQHIDTLPLSRSAGELIQKSLKKRWVNRLMVASLAVIPLIAVESFLREEAVKRDYATLRENSTAGKPLAVLALASGCRELRSWPEQLYLIGERIFGNCRSLAYLNLQKVDLIAADLSNADLIYTNLSGADLTRADVISASLRNANLSGADLTGVNLSGADLSSVNLSGADLIFANFSNANLSRANLSGANLSRAGLGRANLSGTNLISADLSNASLIYTDLNGASLIYTNLNGANFTNASLSGASLSGANLSGANLSGANLSGTDFSIAVDFEPDLSNADLSAAKEQLSQAILCRTILPEVVNLDPNQDCKMGTGPEQQPPSQ